MSRFTWYGKRGEFPARKAVVLLHVDVFTDVDLSELAIGYLRLTDDDGLVHYAVITAGEISEIESDDVEEY